MRRFPLVSQWCNGSNCWGMCQTSPQRMISVWEMCASLLRSISRGRGKTKSVNVLFTTSMEISLRRAQRLVPDEKAHKQAHGRRRCRYNPNPAERGCQDLSQDLLQFKGKFFQISQCSNLLRPRSRNSCGIPAVLGLLSRCLSSFCKTT